MRQAMRLCASQAGFTLKARTQGYEGLTHARCQSTLPCVTEAGFVNALCVASLHVSGSWHAVRLPCQLQCQLGRLTPTGLSTRMHETSSVNPPFSSPCMHGTISRCSWRRGVASCLFPDEIARRVSQYVLTQRKPVKKTPTSEVLTSFDFYAADPGASV